MNAAKASTGRAGDIVAAVYDRRTSPDVASAPCADTPRRPSPVPARRALGGALWSAEACLRF